ncbi:MAG: hypothetical protein ACLSUW_05895 [Akkermansia sp.]
MIPTREAGSLLRRQRLMARRADRTLPFDSPGACSSWSGRPAVRGRAGKGICSFGVAESSVNAL